MDLFSRILESRGLSGNDRDKFLNPKYNDLYDPFLLPDMDKAVDRLILARSKKETILVYGDYDIDGIAATTLLVEALGKLGFSGVDYYIPNRFSDGYGLSLESLKKLINKGYSLVITVDCGSLNDQEIRFANSKMIDVIVTDHHNPAKKQPPALAVINPKRDDSNYPFSDLAGVGVAFKLVQALQRKIEGFSLGQEKWLLDLVCLGTICDIVPLVDENRILAYWGIKVLDKTRRYGLLSLVSIAGGFEDINSRFIGYRLGPRLNAAGRLETAEHAIKLLRSNNKDESDELAKLLDELNNARQLEQAKIIKEALVKAKKYEKDKVLVLASKDWHAGVVGIAAAKVAELLKKPTYILQDLGLELKGSARSFWGFNVSGAIDYSRRLVVSGGGHNLAAGVSLSKKNLVAFRKSLNQYYKETIKSDEKIIIKEDTVANLDELNESNFRAIGKMEPFGCSNPQPVLRTNNLVVESLKKMGDHNQHIKYCLSDGRSRVDFLHFNSNESQVALVGDLVNVWYYLDLNDWRGYKAIQGKIINLEVATA